MTTPLPPGPRGLQKLPALRQLTRTETIELTAELTANYGPISMLAAGPLKMVFLTQPHHFEQVLVKKKANYPKSQLLRELRHVTGEGLLISEGERWQKQRRAAQPSFARRAMGELAPTMADCAEAARAHFRAMPSGTQVDMSVEMVQVALTVLLRTMFSNSLERSVEEIHHAVSSAMRSVSQRMLSLVRLPVGVPTPVNRRLRAAMAVIDQEIMRIIKGRQATGALGDDLLGRLMRADGMTEQDLRDHCVTMFVAGHDTVAMALTWAWYFLDGAPDARARLEAEADRVIGDGPLTAAQIPELTWAAQVMEESMRLVPQPSALFRNPLEDDVIDGFRIPKGAEVVLCTHVMHNNPDLWDDAAAFRPERFGPDGPDRHRYQYLPFGSGARICIGKTFSMLEGPAVLGALAREFRFARVNSSPPGMRVAAVTEPEGGMPMTVHHRD